MEKTILITGGAGFIGSNLAIKLKQKYPACNIIVFDNLKRRGSELNLPRLKEYGIIFLHGDIRCREDFEQIGPVDTIIDASAEPSVLTGINKEAEYLIIKSYYLYASNSIETKKLERFKTVVKSYNDYRSDFTKEFGPDALRMNDDAMKEIQKREGKATVTVH